MLLLKCDNISNVFGIDSEVRDYIDECDVDREVFTDKMAKKWRLDEFGMKDYMGFKPEDRCEQISSSWATWTLIGGIGTLYHGMIFDNDISKAVGAIGSAAIGAYILGANAINEKRKKDVVKDYAGKVFDYHEKSKDMGTEDLFWMAGADPKYMPDTPE